MLASSTSMPAAAPRASTHLPALALLRDHREAGARRRAAAESTSRERVLTMHEVVQAGYVVVEDSVFDIEPFARRHPGGAFLRGLAGTDATLAIRNAHGKSDVVAKCLRRLRVGAFDRTTREPLTHDVLALAETFRREGLFDYPLERLAFDVVRWCVLLGGGIALAAAGRASLLSFALVLAGTIDVVWWIHDAGHDAIFAREVTARRAIEWLGVLVLGMPQQGYHYGVHRIHHGFTNVVGVDRALETGPLSWDAASTAKKPAVFARARLAQWFMAIVPFAGPALLVSALIECRRKRQWWLLTAVLVRWLVVVAACASARALPLVVVPWVAGSVLAFMAGLNHFHLPLSTTPPASYVRAVFERTQNLDAGPFWHWLSGGLDLHVEHHLFPTMPSYRYRRIAPHVRALAERHGVPYRTTSRSGAVRALVRTLLRPLPMATRDGLAPRSRA
jgi:fatty acid desaturase